MGCTSSKATTATKAPSTTVISKDGYAAEPGYAAGDVASVQLPTSLEKKVLNILTVWGAGKFNSEGREAVWDELFDTECSFAFSYDASEASPWKTVTGRDECLVGCFDRMGPAPPAIVDVGGFAVVWVKEIHGVVYAKSICKHTSHATGKSVDNVNYQEWVFDPVSGKPRKVLNTFQHPDLCDAIFNDGQPYPAAYGAAFSAAVFAKDIYGQPEYVEAAPNKVEDPTLLEKTVQNVVAAWGAGKLNLAGKETVWDSLFTKDCSFLNGYNFKAAPWKNCTGKSECLNFFDQMGPAPPAIVGVDDFTIVFMKEIAGVVVVKTRAKQTCHATGKSVNYVDYQEWIFDPVSGKPCKVIGTVQYPQSIEAIYS